MSLGEYVVSLLVLFGGWMVALFGIAGQARPGGIVSFAITAAAGLGFVTISWVIYGSNIKTLIWVADLMEDRLLNTRKNWQEETMRSLVEVGSWLHITFRIYAISESAAVAAFCGAVVGAFCVVLGEYFTGYTDHSRRRQQPAQAPVASQQPTPSPSPEDDNGSTGRGQEPSDAFKELVSVVYTPQFASLATAFVLAASLYHFEESQDLGLAVILTTLANVAFITTEEFLMLWQPTQWAAAILQDRVTNLVHNWQHKTIRSGFETSFYLSSIFSSYCLFENVPLAVLSGTVAGVFIVLASVRTEQRQPESATKRRIFMFVMFAWAFATLLYTVFVFSRNALLAILLVVPTGVALLCMAEIAMDSLRKAKTRTQDHHRQQASQHPALKSKWSAFRFTLGSLWNDIVEDDQSLRPVRIAEVAASAEKLFPHALMSAKATRSVSRAEMVGQQWILIEGFVFDVSGFAKEHPGGEYLLRDFASRQADASDQFAAFHHPAVYKRLLPLLVGKLEEGAVPRASPASKSYRDLRRYLWKNGYFDGAESDLASARSCLLHHFIILSLGILALCQVALLGLVLRTTPAEERAGTVFTAQKYLQCILAAATLGFFWQQVAFVAHDALHNGVVNRTKERRTKSRLVPNNVLGWFHGSVLFGISSAMWLDEHNVHHAITMRPCQDAQFNYLPLWCVSLKEFASDQWQSLKSQSRATPLLTSCLVAVQHYTLLPLAVLVGRFNFAVINISYAVQHGFYFDLAGMAIFWASFAVLLSAMSGDLRLQICFVLVSHWTVGILHVQLLINHLATDAFTPEEEDKLQFFTFQMRTTRNIDSTPDTDWFHGGLQYQIEHHLFPQLPRHRLALVKPAVQDICEANGIPYESVGFFRAIQLTLLNFRDIAHEVWSGNLAA